MYEDIKDDSYYKQAKSGLFGSLVRSKVWGGIAAVAGMALLAGIHVLNPLALVAIAAVGAVSMYKAWSARTDEKAEMADVGAQRTAHHISRAMQQEREQEQDSGRSSYWADKVARERQAAYQSQR
jgi:hypothetical protein